MPAAQRSGTVHFSMQTPEGDRGYHTAEDDPMSNGSEPDQEEPLDGLGRLMQQFDYDEALHSRVGHQAGGLSASRRTDRAQSGPGAVPQAAGRDAPPWQQAPLVPAMALQMQIQYEMLRQMRALGASSASRDDAPDADALDGLRVSRSLGRMRSLRETMEQNPERTYREYKDQWVRELGAEGRAFRWADRNKSIRLGKLNSVRRCDWMLCHILETLERGDGALAKAQTVQCLKSLHEFSNNGEWKTSWPLTHMVDPLRAHAHGGTEVEMEAVLG